MLDLAGSRWLDLVGGFLPDIGEGIFGHKRLDSKELNSYSMYRLADKAPAARAIEGAPTWATMQ